MAQLSLNSVIDRAKITKYLLVPLPKDDKSQFLSQAGYTLENWQQLERDLRTQILPLEAELIEDTRYGQKYILLILPLEAELIEDTRYGQKYIIRGSLTGTNGTTLRVKTVWMVTSSETRFITLVPN